MIIFYNKETGDIFSTMDGRVHNERQMNCYVDNGIGKEKIGKYIIGWIEKNGKKMEYNIDKLSILQKFEDYTPFSPLDCKVLDGNLILPENNSTKQPKNGIIKT